MFIRGTQCHLHVVDIFVVTGSAKLLYVVNKTFLNRSLKTVFSGVAADSPN